MKRKLRLLATLVALMLCVGLFLTACANNNANNNTTDNNTTDNNTTDNNTTDNNTANTDEQVALKFWHIWGSGDSNSEAVAKVIADFENAYPNIKIDVETFENDSYKTKIETDVAGGNAPDIFSTWGGGFSQGFVDAGKVLKLDDYLDADTQAKIFPGALKNYTYNGNIYGLTFGQSVSGLFCNNRLFQENGLEIPKTWEDLLNCVTVFKEKGITPITTSIKESWVVGMLFEGLCIKTAGAEASYKALTKASDGTFSDPNFLLAAQKMMELVELGALNEDAAAISRDDAEIALKSGEAAMYYMGSWAGGTVNADDCVDKGNFTFVTFPVVGDAGKGTEFNGGGVDGIMASANTAHPEEAATFAKYFCENLARENYIAGNYLPLWKVDGVDESAINPVMIQIKDATASATDYVLWWDTLLAGDDVKTYQDALNNMLAKQTTPEQFIEELKKIQP